LAYNDAVQRPNIGGAAFAQAKGVTPILGPLETPLLEGISL
jgi:hypothetical protein